MKSLLWTSLLIRPRFVASEFQNIYLFLLTSAINKVASIVILNILDCDVFPDPLVKVMMDALKSAGWWVNTSLLRHVIPNPI